MLKMMLICILLTVPAVVVADLPPALPDTHPEVVITAPLAGAKLYAVVEVQGSAAAPGLMNYLLDLQPLAAGDHPITGAPWMPVSGMVNQPVSGGLLAAVDTTSLPNGRYALRLLVTTRDGQSFASVISPLDIENPVSPLPAPSPGEDGTPLVTAALFSAAVRECDHADNARCPVIGFLKRGESAVALAASASGGYQVRLTSGLTGWVIATDVTIIGAVERLAQVDSPAAREAAVLPDNAEIRVNGIGLDTREPACGVAFAVLVNVVNVSQVNVPAGWITVQDISPLTGVINASAREQYPALRPGQTVTLPLPLVVQAFDGQIHQVRAFGGGTLITATYDLQRGDCPIPAGSG